MNLILMALVFYALVSPKKGKADWIVVGIIVLCYLLNWKFGLYPQTFFINALILLTTFLWYGVIRASEDEPVLKRKLERFKNQK